MCVIKNWQRNGHVRAMICMDMHETYVYMFAIHLLYMQRGKPNAINLTFEDDSYNPNKKTAI